jgi:hypothetical protein
VKLIAETTHHVQKALKTNAWIYKKYIENRKPKVTIACIGQKGITPPVNI